MFSLGLFGFCVFLWSMVFGCYFCCVWVVIVFTLTCMVFCFWGGRFVLFGGVWGYICVVCWVVMSFLIWVRPVISIAMDSMYIVIAMVFIIGISSRGRDMVLRVPPALVVELL